MELTNNHGHQELLTRYLRIAAHGDGQPTLFTTEVGMEKVDENVPTDDIETVVGEPSREFFDRIERRCKRDLDVLFINTIEGTIGDYVKYLRFNPDCATVLWPHNARAWFERQLVFSTGGGLTTTISTNCKNIFRPPILKRMDGILVPFEQSRRHIESTYTLSQSIHALSPSVYDPVETDEGANSGTTSAATDDGPVRVTIPGSIVDRRDYDVVLDAFGTELLPTFGDDIRLTLLGRPQGDYGERIVERAADLADRGYDVQYFTEWIETDTYAEVFQGSDLLLNPISKDEGERAERWGLTWNSGVLFDVLMHPCPMILPDRYSIPDELDGAALSYSNGADLATTVAAIVESSDRQNELATAAVKNAEQCTVDRQFQRFSRIVDAHTS